VKKVISLDNILDTIKGIWYNGVIEIGKGDSDMGILREMFGGVTYKGYDDIDDCRVCKGRCRYSHDDVEHCNLCRGRCKHIDD